MTGLAKFIGWLLILLPIGSWSLMLLLQILHAEVSPTVPPLGFWICVGIVALTACVKSAIAPDWPEDGE